MTDTKTPAPQTHVAVSLDAEDRLKRELVDQLTRFVRDFEHLPVNDVAVQNLFAQHLSGRQNGFLIGEIIAGKLGSFGILTESTVFSDMEVIAGHDADSVSDRTSVRAVSSTQEHPNLAALEEIKYLTCTIGAPGHMTVAKGLARILWLCNRAGVTKKLDELRPLFATTEGE